ncbi:MAG TPA: TIGR01777 family oxidoreductase [Cytophagaceae bacterium]|jgi:hypothetical protein
MNVLITGGTGLVGTRLTALLQNKGYQVSHLSRKPSNGPIKTYVWDVGKKTIETEAIETADYIVHLAGAGVFDEAWSSNYKKQIFDSRINSTTFLIESIQKSTNKVKAFVCASAIGIYGNDTGSKVVTEATAAGNDFLADVVKHWERAADLANKVGIRTVKIRIGIVLSEYGGALEKFVQPIKYGAGSALGTGNQYISWIHIDDLCRIFIHSIENSSIVGAYNGVAPEPVTNKELISHCAKILNKPLILPNVPAFVLKIVLGSERSKSVLGGNNVSAEKIKRTGFNFSHPKIEEALESLLKK